MHSLEHLFEINVCVSPIPDLYSGKRLMVRSAIIKALLALVLLPVGADADTPPEHRDVSTATRDAQAVTASTSGERAALSGISTRDEDPEAALLRELGAALDALSKDEALAGSTTALYVVDAHTGDVLYAAAEDQPVNPASNVKLIATAAALDLLGPDFRYTTRVLGPRPQAGGVVSGDLYLHGNWDPTLDSDAIRSLADQMVQAGIVRVDGTIHVGAGTAIPGIRSSERESVSSPRVQVQVIGARRPGEVPTVEVTPSLDFIDVQVSATTVARTRGKNRVQLGVSSALVIDDHGVTRWQISITGRIPTRRRARYQRRAPDGGLFSGHLLRQALRDAGVTGLDDLARVERTSLTDYMSKRATSFLPLELARHDSEPLSALIHTINKRSHNRLADRVTMTMGAARYGGQPSMDAGVRAMKEWLARNASADLDKTVLDTGSGLSYQTQLTARQIVDVVRAAAGFKRDARARGPSTAALGAAFGDASAQDDPAARALDPSGRAALYRDSLAIGGVDGTLLRRFRRSSARRHVVGKTGTLTRVIALSGIVSAGPDNELVFAIVSNDHARVQRSSVRKQHERMVEAMYRYARAR